MKRIPVNDIQGGEILAKDLFLENGAVFMGEGSILRKAYVDRLRNKKFEYIDIVDSPTSNLVDQATERVIQKHCRETVRDTIDRYSYGLNAELTEIATVADKIMSEILAQPEVLYNVSRIRDKSESTYLHSINVAALAILVGAKMKVPERRLKNIAVGSLLHDIGLIYVPIDLRIIDIERCSNEVVKELKKHVIYGYSAIEKEEWIAVAAKDIIINHHERLDGSGYPFHLTTEKMSLETKIVSVCDEFDSQVYGNFTKKMKIHEVVDYLMSKAGTLFDLKVVQAFVASVAVYPLGTTVCTNEGEVGIVIRQNEALPTRPVIRVISTAQSKETDQSKAADSGKITDSVKIAENSYEKDLARSLTTFIIDTLEN